MSTAILPDDPQLRERFSELKPPLAPQAAVIEADRCLNCFDAPCTAACPTHIDVPGFIKRIASGNMRGSAMRILDANILGSSCARVCPVDVLCEGACVLHRQNRKPIQIALLQRHAMDTFHASGEQLPAAQLASLKLRVSDDKISFEYKVKRFLQGTLMDEGAAHLYWNGTFSDEEKERLFRYADSGPLAGVSRLWSAGSSPRR